LKKRLMAGLVAGGLMAAMLPGVASADSTDLLGQCVANGIFGTPPDGGTHVGKAGDGRWLLPNQVLEVFKSGGTVWDAGGNGPDWEGILLYCNI
jgi:hypothetical protein